MLRFVLALLVGLSFITDLSAMTNEKVTRGKIAPATPEQLAKSAQMKFQREQLTTAAIKARSPDGLVIDSFYKGDGGKLVIKLRNITGTSQSIDGTKLRAVDFYTGREFSGEGTSGMYVDAGKTKEVIIGLFGTNEGAIGLQWAGTAAWTDGAGKVFPTRDDLVAARRAEVEKIRQKIREHTLSPVAADKGPGQAVPGR